MSNLDYSRWMEQLEKSIAKRTIRQVVLPGSHDAGTASISPSSPLSPDAPDLAHLVPSTIIGPTICAWSRAQGVHLGEQLEAGIRYFDLRVARNDSDGKLYFAHSMFGDDVLNSIEQIAKFLRIHSRELLILDFQHFLNLNAADHAALAQTIEAAFGSILVPPPQGGVFSTMESVWSSGQQVIVVYSDEAGANDVLASHAHFWSRNLISSKWANTTDPIKLREYLRTVVNGAPLEQLFVLQGVLTPDTGTILHGLIGKPKSLRQLAEIANPQVVSWCTTEWATMGLNIIMADWTTDSNIVDAAILINTQKIVLSSNGLGMPDCPPQATSSRRSHRGDIKMPDLNATISQVRVTFFTHNDNKDHDTSISALVQNKVNLFLSQDLARLDNFAGNQEFGDNPPSSNTFVLALASDNIKLSQLNVPTYKITIAPVGHDRWIFDCTVTIKASDGSEFSSTNQGIILDQDNRVFTGVFGA